MMHSKKVTPVHPVQKSGGDNLVKVTAVDSSKAFKHSEIPTSLFNDVGKDDFVQDFEEVIPEVPVILIENVASSAEKKVLATSENASLLLEAPEPVYDKYRTMFKCGLSMYTVEKKMKQDGVPFPSKKIAPPPLTDANKKQPTDEQMQKYKQMIKCGLPQGAVEHKMKQDGVDVLLLFPRQEENGASKSNSEATKAVVPSMALDEPANGKTLELRKSPQVASPVKAASVTVKYLESSPVKILDSTKLSGMVSSIKALESSLVKTSVESSPEKAALESTLDEAPVLSLVKNTMESPVRKTAFESSPVEIALESSTLESSPVKTTLDSSPVGAALESSPVKAAFESSPIKEPLPMKTVLVSSIASPDKIFKTFPVKTCTGMARDVIESSSSSVETRTKEEFDGLVAELASFEDGQCTFGALGERYSQTRPKENLKGILMRAKKRALIEYKGEMLYQGKDDFTIIALVHIQTSSPVKPIPVVVAPSINKLEHEVAPLVSKAVLSQRVDQDSDEIVKEIDQEHTQEADSINEDDDNNVTGRGPPPMPPPALVAAGDQNRSRHSVSKPRSPSKLNRLSRGSSLASESMFDIFGRRRSSATVYRLALNVMESRDVETIPRSEITDALNWTTAVSSGKEIFSFENAQGLELGRAMERLSLQTALKRRPTMTTTVRNQTQAAVLLQRVLRGWMTRIKYKSCTWVRDRLNSAVRSRLPEKVEEALAASRAIASKFVRPPEHERAVASLDTIREERAIRPKILELSECKISDGKDVLKRFASVIERMSRCRASDPHAFRDEASVKAELVYEACNRRAELCIKLQRSGDAMIPSDMMQALQECDAAAARYQGIWEESFLQEEKKRTRKILVAIQHEEPALIGLMKTCCSGDTFRVHPELLFQRTNFDQLEQAIAKAVEDLGFAPTSPGAAHILALGNAILTLHKSLQSKHHTWTMCEKLLGEARARLCAWKSLKEGIFYLSQWYPLLESELDLVSSALDRKAGVHDLIEALNDSVERCDVDDIRNVLNKGEKRGLQERVHDVPLQQTISKAKEYLEKYSLIHARLAECLSGVNRSPTVLEQVAQQVRLAVLPGSSDDRLVKECDRLCAFARDELVPMISKAVETVPDRADLEQVVERVRKQERMGGIPELVQIEELLNMNEFRLVQEQLRGTTRTHDEKRKVAPTIKFRQLHLEQTPAMFRFHNFSDLKDPKEWSLQSSSSSKRLLRGTFGGGKRETRAARMLFSSRSPIHSPLTNAAEFDVKNKRFALKANRTLLAYSGDLDVDDLTEFGGDVCQGLHELLVFALAETQVRDEVYCQIMKHLSENNRPGSGTRAWNVMALCLLTFPPSTCLDLFLEFFIRTTAPAPDMESLLDNLHHAVFVGERPTAPTLSDVKARQDDGGSVERF